MFGHLKFCWITSEHVAGEAELASLAQEQSRALRSLRAPEGHSPATLPTWPGPQVYLLLAAHPGPGLRHRPDRVRNPHSGHTGLGEGLTQQVWGS